MGSLWINLVWDGGIFVTAANAAGNYHIFFETILLKQTMRGLQGDVQIILILQSEILFFVALRTKPI